MYNYYLAGLFVKHHGRLPKDKKELAKFILFGGTIKWFYISNQQKTALN